MNRLEHKPRSIVWVVDDSRGDRERAERALAGDHVITGFEDGAAALEALSAGDQPDVLVLDVMMPNLSGLEICQHLRAERNARTHLPILLLTANRDPAQVVSCLGAGADDFLAKPYHDAELRARVAALVRTRQLLVRSEHAEATLRELLERAPDALVAVGPDGLVTAANEEAGRLFAAAPGSLVSRSVIELLPELSHRDIVRRPRGSVAHLPDVVVGDRLYAPMVKTLEPPYGYTIALRDVTETRVEEKRRMDFYSVVAHDLRSPLGAILLRSSLIRRGKHGILPAGLLGDIEKIESTIHSLVTLINDFLDLARLQGAGLKLDRAPLDLAELVSESLEQLRPLAEASQLGLVARAPTAPAVVSGDRRRLGQVLANLLSNAIKFTAPGGTIETEVREQDCEVVISVKDNGPGIPAEAIPTLFDRFTRVDRTEHQVVGSGLGLMIVRQVVEAHGGRVYVESQLGQGSTFFCALPKGV